VLVLTRRAGERVLVGDVELVVLETHRGRVRLGFEAPRGTQILRLELVAEAGATGDAAGRRRRGGLTRPR
jgi:carbon storage regulator CsrA